MTIKIEVKSTEVATKSGTSAKTGKPYNIREQVGVWAYTADRHGNPHPYPQRISVQLQEDQDAYPVGVYTVAPESFYVNRFGGLECGLVLKAVASSLGKAAA